MGIFLSILFFVFITIAVWIGLVLERPDEDLAMRMRMRKVAAAVIAISFIGLFIFPLPHMREQARLETEHARLEKEAEAQRIAAKIKAEDDQRDRANEQKILHASEKEIRALVMKCQTLIEDQLAKNKPAFAPYFARYKYYDLQKLKDIALTMGMPLGRPSVALDDYDFDPIQYNIEAIMRKELPQRSIEFVVEHTIDSFGGLKGYVAKFTCFLEGTKIVGEPYRGRMIFTD